MVVSGVHLTQLSGRGRVEIFARSYGVDHIPFGDDPGYALALGHDKSPDAVRGVKRCAI